MNIEQLKTAMEVVKLMGGDSCVTTFPESVGTNVFIRTVTMYYLGRIKKICGEWVTLEEASWIADTGRFNDFLKSGKANEVEPFVNEVHIPLGSLIDVTKFDHKLPREQK